MAASVLRVVSDLSDALPPETWGARFLRCRKDYGTADVLVADLATVGVVTSTATISRIEKGHEAPTTLERRIVATASVVLFGFSPAALDLDIDDLPGNVYTALLSRPDGGGGQRVGKSGWTSRAVPPRSHLAAVPLAPRRAA